MNMKNKLEHGGLPDVQMSQLISSEKLPEILINQSIRKGTLRH